MNKVSFHYNFKKDAWSWAYIAKDRENTWGLDWKKQVGFIPDDLLKKIIKRSSKAAKFLIYKHLINHPKKQIRQLAIKEKLKSSENYWQKIENKFFKKLEKIMEKPIFINNFKCYATSGFMCPYNEKENWFMISMWHNTSMSIMVICHEIFHLQFLHYYKKHCRKILSEKQTEDLKEALTFILNTDFNELLLVKDGGYPSHQKLRKELEKIWNKKDSFQEFLDEAINIVKKGKY